MSIQLSEAMFASYSLCVRHWRQNADSMWWFQSYIYW